MSIAAWMTDAKMTVSNDNSEQAYRAIKSAYASNIIRYNGDHSYLDDLLSQSDLAAFFEMMLYAVERHEDAITIGKGDMDTINDKFCKLFETIAPFVEPGGYIHIEDEEEQYLNLSFDGGMVHYDGDAY